MAFSVVRVFMFCGVVSFEQNDREDGEIKSTQKQAMCVTVLWKSKKGSGELRTLNNDDEDGGVRLGRDG